MALNPVQQDFTNEDARVFVERLIQFAHILRIYSKRYKAIQAGDTANRMPITPAALDDAGQNPRADAPNLTGVDLVELETIADNMLAQLTPAMEQVFLAKSKRTVASITRIS